MNPGPEWNPSENFPQVSARCLIRAFGWPFDLFDREAISAVMAAMARKRAHSLTPERRRAIAALGGKAGKGKPKPRRS